MKSTKRFLPQVKLGAMAVALMASTMFYSSCKEKDDKKNPPVITSVGSGQGHTGDTVTITGKNFGTELSKVDVFFGTASATVISAASTSIKASVPNLSPSDYEVKVSVNGESSGTLTFTVLEDAKPEVHIVLDSFSPTTIEYDQTLTITGKHFTSDAKVFVNDKEQTEGFSVSSDSTTITVKMEAKTFSGKVRVEQGNDTEIFDEELHYKLNFKKPTPFSNLQVSSLAFLEDGTSYAAYDEGLVKLDAQGEITDTLLPLKSGYLWIGKLYMTRDEKTLYMTEDANASIYKLTVGSKKVDSVVVDNKDFPAFKLGTICGNSNDTLYVTTSANKGVARVSLSSTSPKVDIIASNYTESTGGVTLRRDTLFLSTKNGVSKFHKNGGTPEYIVTQAQDGYNFSGGGITLHEGTQDLFLAGGYSYDLHRLNHKNEIDQIADQTSLGIENSATSVAINHEGDLFVTADKIIKIETY